MWPYQADAGGWNSMFLQQMTENASGDRAAGSDRKKKYRVYFIFF